MEPTPFLLGYLGPMETWYKRILQGCVLLLHCEQSCGNCAALAAHEWINPTQMFYFKSISFRLQEIFKALWLEVIAYNCNTADCKQKMWRYFFITFPVWVCQENYYSCSGVYWHCVNHELWLISPPLSALSLIKHQWTWLAAALKAKCLKLRCFKR